MANAASADLAALVTLAFAAIDDDTHWQPLVERFAALFDQAHALILVDEHGGATPRVAVCSQRDALDHYLRGPRRTDPLLDEATLAQMSARRRACLSHELVSDRRLRESAFYAEFLLPQGNLFYAVGGNFRLGPQLLIQVWAYRSKAHGAFDEQDRELADALVQPLLQAAELGARLRRLEAETAHQLAIQDHLLDAVIVLDGAGRLVHCNARGRDLLEGHAYGTTLPPRALRLAGNGEQQRLQAALGRARRSAGPVALRLQRQKPLPALYAVLVGGGADAAVRLFLRDPRWSKFLPEESLVEIFDLTAAQARVCAAVVRGESIEDIASRLNVQLATVRGQLKAAMEKIGMHRQSDLVRHLALAMPALLHPPSATP